MIIMYAVVVVVAVNARVSMAVVIIGALIVGVAIAVQIRPLTVTTVRSVADYYAGSVGTRLAGIRRDWSAGVAVYDLTRQAGRGRSHSCR